jgi:hypothetical protein
VQYLAAPPPRSSNGDMGVLAQVVRDAKAIGFDIYAVTIGQLGALYVFVRYDLPIVAMNVAGGAPYPGSRRFWENHLRSATAALRLLWPSGLGSWEAVHEWKSSGAKSG